MAGCLIQFFNLVEHCGMQQLLKGMQGFRVLENFIGNHPPAQFPINENVVTEKAYDLPTKAGIGREQFVDNRIGVDDEGPEFLKNPANGGLSACYPTCDRNSF